MRYSVKAFVVLATVIFIGCGQNEKETSGIPDSKEPTETQVFLNIDVEAIKDSVLKHFDEVDSHGLQAKSEPGGPGFMAVNGRKIQRFQIKGTISEDGRQALYAQLKSDIESVLDANGGALVGEIKNTVRDRPIWYFSIVIPSGSPVDFAHFEGFYLEYTTDLGNGFVDVMACKSMDEESENTWEIGLAIHETHEM